jgi:Na+/H+-dicarboxylate symporter
MFLKKITLPVQLLIVIILVGLFGKYLSPELIKGSYTFSLIFKEILTALLPYMIFSFISTGFFSFKSKAPIIFSVLLLFIIISNTTAAFFSFFIGKISLNWLVNSMNTSHLNTYSPLEPYFFIKIPTIIKSETAMVFSVITGILLSMFPQENIENSILLFKKFIEKILKRILIPLLPFYVLGFLLKVQDEGVFITLFRSYGKTFIFIIGLQVIYILIMFLIASNFNIKKMMFYIKNSIASYITAFSTMSSTVTIPITVKGAQKNTKNKPLADLSVPILANIHLLGAGLKLPILTMVTMQIFQGTTIDIYSFFIFLFYFSIMLLATAGIPGGGIIVMSPVLASLLNFTPEMISSITTLYILQDSFGTATNVMGDNALVIIINKVLKKLKILKKQPQQS